MAVNRRVAQTLLEFKIATGEIAQARRAIQSLEIGYAELRDMARDTDKILALGVNRLAVVARTTRSQAVPSVDTLRDSLNEAAQAAERLNDEEEKSGRSGGFGGVKRLGRLAGNVPGLEGVQGGFNVADDIADAADALSRMGPLATAAAGGVLAVGAGLLALNVSLADSKKQLDAATASNQFYYSEVRRLTSEQAEQRLADIRQSLDDQRAELANIEQAFGSGFASAQQQFGEAGAKVITALGQLSNADDALTARADELRASIIVLEGQEGALNRARVDGTAAANDAAAAEQALAIARQNAVDAAAATQLRTLVQATSLSTKAIEDRIDAIHLETAGINQLISTGNLSDEMVNSLNARLSELAVESNTLLSQVAPLVAAREAETAAAEALAERQKALRERLDELKDSSADLREELTKARAGIDDLNADFARKLAQLGQQLTDAQVKAANDRDKALAEATADATDARAEAAREAAQEREDAERDHVKNLQRIARDYFRSRERAIQDRDAVALDAARQTAEDALSDEQQSYDERKKEIQRRLDETNREIDKRLVQQRNMAIARYNEQLQAAAQAYNRQRQLEQQKYNDELARRNAALNALLQQQNTFGIQMQNLWAQLHNKLLQTTAQAFSGGSVPPAGGTPPKPPKSPKPPKFAGGADVYKTGMAIVHAGEKIRTQQQMRDTGGMSIPININGMGMSDAQIENKVIMTLREALRQARKGT